MENLDQSQAWTTPQRKTSKTFLGTAVAKAIDELPARQKSTAADIH
jgi:hypothetical protein